MNRLRVLLLSLVLASCAAPPLLAQTVRSVAKGVDSVLLITTLPKCTTLCPDSARLSWHYGAGAVVRIVRAKAVDTVRIARTAGNAVLEYTPYKTATKLAVVPVPIVAVTTDTVFEFYAANGTRIVDSLVMAPTDSLRAVAVIRRSDGTRKRPTTVVTWRYAPLLVLARASAGVKDTVWLKPAPSALRQRLMPGRSLASLAMPFVFRIGG